MSIPMLFMRCTPCPPGGRVKPNQNQMGSPQRVSYIVALPTCSDYTPIRTAWQCNPAFPEGEIFAPSIDLLADENTFVFDEEDAEESYQKAHAKMRELWQVAHTGVKK